MKDKLPLQGSPIARFDKGLSNLLGVSLWLMALSLTTVVLLRYVVGYGATWLNDIAVYLLAAICLLGFSETFQQDRHVRLDILYARMTNRAQIWVNLIGNIGLLIPFCIFLVASSLGYVFRSWQLMEGSGEAAGLGGLYFIKTLILIGPSLLALQAVRQSLKLFKLLKKKTNL